MTPSLEVAAAIAGGAFIGSLVTLLFAYQWRRQDGREKYIQLAEADSKIETLERLLKYGARGGGTALRAKEPNLRSPIIPTIDQSSSKPSVVAIPEKDSLSRA